MIIKYILIASLVILLILFLRGRRGSQWRAGKKVGLTVFIMAGLAAVVAPEQLNTIAHAVGVGRGADLLLYALTVTFVFATLNGYLKQQDTDRRIAELAREIAIDRAQAEKERNQ